MVEPEDIDMRKLTIVGINVVLVVLLAILGIQVLYYHYEKAEFNTKFVEPGYTELKRIQKEQTGALSEYHWVQKNNGVIAIPVEQAMDIVVAQLKAKKQ